MLLYIIIYPKYTIIVYIISLYHIIYMCVCVCVWFAISTNKDF